jgi:hypothetical protein
VCVFTHFTEWRVCILENAFQWEGLPVRYNQLEPTVWDVNGAFTHSVFYGKDALSDLEKGIVELSRLPSPTPAGFWAAAWRSGKLLASKRFASQKATRGIIVRNTGRPPRTPPWNSWYIASPEFADNILNCELFANDCWRRVHITGDWLQDPTFELKYKDYCYLEIIDPLASIPRAPSPAIATGNWYDPSNPLTSFRNQLRASFPFTQCG